MILHNARIHTMDQALPTASALAIAGGRILGGVDSREDVIASHAHERIDLQGATVVPGLVDAHVHFRSWAASRTRVDLRDASSFDGVVEAVRVHADGLDAGGWVLGGGWRDELVPRDVDVAAALEQAAGGRPSALVSKDGHALWTTARALEQLGIHDVDVQLGIPGGVIERTTDGRFAGVLRELSAWAVRRLLPDDDITIAVLAKAMRDANRRGVTAVHDMDGAVGFRAWRQLEAERGLTLRVWQYFLDSELEHLGELGMTAGFGSPRLRVAGIKAFADGTLGSGTAWLHEPELGDAPRGAVVITGKVELRALALDAARAGLPLAVHAIGDGAFTAVVDALEHTHGAWSTLPAPPRVEHAQLARASDIQRAARLGIAMSVQPSQLVNDRDEADRRWGHERCASAFAFRTMIEAGTLVALGSDAPIEDVNPLAALHAATARDGGAHGLAPSRGAWHPAQAISPVAALVASTAAAADIVGAGAELGRLVPGRAADLVVLTDDPVTTPPGGVEVVATMVGGRWVYGSDAL